jgi:hypothetical protein
MNFFQQVVALERKRLCVHCGPTASCIEGKVCGSDCAIQLRVLLYSIPSHRAGINDDTEVRSSSNSLRWWEQGGRDCCFIVTSPGFTAMTKELPHAVVGRYIRTESKGLFPTGNCLTIHCAALTTNAAQTSSNRALPASNYNSTQTLMSYWTFTSQHAMSATHTLRKGWNLKVEGYTRQVDDKQYQSLLKPQQTRAA